MDVLGKIKWLMKERGWNTAKLAEKAGLQRSTLSSLFRRNHQPTISTLTYICDAFGIRLGHFFEDGDIPMGLTPEHAELLTRWNGLTDVQKRILLELIENMRDGNRLC